MAAYYEESDSRVVYQRHKEKAELPFDHIKRNLWSDSLLLRGLAGIRVEMSLLSSCFNMARLICLFGVSGLVERLSLLKEIL